MEQVIIELPEDLAKEFRQRPDHLREVILLGLTQLKAQEALTLYSKGVVSLERSAEIAGLSLREMIRQARAIGIQPRWTDQMAQAELL
ncbi:MAG: antitoxin [Chloroflexota bacterium]